MDSLGSNNYDEEPAIAIHQSETELDPIPKLESLYTLCGFNGEKDLTGDAEYIEIKGGRGGGKSESVAQALILLSRVESCGILCTREVQKSMKDSVYKMLVDWIIKYNLGDEFNITRDTIKNTYTGCYFIFMGMAAAIQADTLKSLKGIKIVWYEEAQTATKASLIKLDPTIRIPGRKLIFTMNENSTNDAVIKYLEKRKKVYRIYVTYLDNQYCPQVLIDQAEEMKELDYDEFLHTWMGLPKPEDLSVVILPYKWLELCVDLHKKVEGFQTADDLEGFRKTDGYDVADGTTEMHDKNSQAQRQGPVVTHVKEWQAKEVYISVQKINRRQRRWGFQRMYYDATAMGTAAKSEFARLDAKRKLPYKVFAFKGGMKPYGADKAFEGRGREKITNRAMFANAKAQLWWNFRLRLMNSMRLIRGKKIDRKDYFISFDSDIEGLESIFRELAQATFEEDNSGRIKVDKAPGIHTVEVEGKDKERRSPNNADAILLSFAGDISSGLRAHQPGRKKAKVYG